MGKKIDVDAAPTRFGTSFPPPYDVQCLGRRRYRLGEAAGLKQFGVNLLRLPAGQWSSQRHWHESDDELIYVLEGEVTLVTDAGEEVLRAGDCAGFKAGERDGHHLQNRSQREAVVIEVGGRSGGPAEYPDIDLVSAPDASGRFLTPNPASDTIYFHRDGTPYPPTSVKHR